MARRQSVFFKACFQGMFEKNILTFHPGWDGNASKLNTFPTFAICSANCKRKAYS
jgi:hypothetical protein